MLGFPGASGSCWSEFGGPCGFLVVCGFVGGSLGWVVVGGCDCGLVVRQREEREREKHKIAEEDSEREKESYQALLVDFPRHGGTATGDAPCSMYTNSPGQKPQQLWCMVQNGLLFHGKNNSGTSSDSISREMRLSSSSLTKTRPSWGDSSSPLSKMVSYHELLLLDPLA